MGKVLQLHFLLSCVVVVTCHSRIGGLVKVLDFWSPQNRLPLILIFFFLVSFEDIFEILGEEKRFPTGTTVP